MTAWPIRLVLTFSWLVYPVGNAADKPGPSSNPEGQALAAELRSARPSESMEVQGSLKIRDADGKRTRVPFRYRFVYGEKTWQNIYQTEPTRDVPAERLQVVHTDGEPNRYLFSRGRGNPESTAESVALAGDELMVPFARSDFWITDLGLEYLHWPEQRIVEEAKIRMRKGRPCKVLESINPRPGAAGYTRVRSWIDTEKRQPILAEAYGPDNKLIKEFEIGTVAKLNGQWQVKDLEMSNAQTDSRTILEFNYEQKDPVR
jgi:hypothetical protein